jgi:hypothetical protein
MRVLLRNARTELYYDKTGAWVREVTTAMDFGTLEDAGKAAFTCQDPDVNVVLRYETPLCELALNPEYCIPWSGAKARAISSAGHQTRSVVSLQRSAR